MRGAFSVLSFVSYSIPPKTIYHMRYITSNMKNEMMSIDFAVKGKIL